MNAEEHKADPSAERTLPTHWYDRLLAWLARRLQPLMNPLRVLLLTGWCTLFFIVGVIFFLGNDQGLDFLRRLVEPGGRYTFLANLFFFLGVLTWALSTWYCARLLVTRRFPHTDQAFFDRTRNLRTWLPRVGGSLVPFIIAGGFLRVTLWGKTRSLAYHLIVLYVVVGILLLAFFWARRMIFEEPVPAKQSHPASWLRRIISSKPGFNYQPPREVESLPSASWHTLVVAFTLATALMVAFLVFPVGLPNALGAPAILLFAAAFWILFGSMIITYWPLANGYPSLTVPLILFALLISGWNDNHAIRATDLKEPTASRDLPEAHFHRWLVQRLERTPSHRSHPVFVVAAAGGGIRAAYWTASVLGRIADESGGAWPDHLYAMSAVSGGSVGSALHAVQIAELISAPTGESAPIPGELWKRARHSLDNDILSPVISYLLFPDLLQRFVPYPFSVSDRARALELAMEAAVAEQNGVNSGRFACRFVELWPAASPYRVPVLLLNTTVVETGQRAIVSNLKIDTTFADALDLLTDAAATQDMPLSTAAHLSARFTYVSPAGTIRTPRGGIWGHIVDGGYFENSGAVTAAELMQSMRKVADAVGKEYSRKVPLMLILIRNDPEAPSVCEPKPGQAQPSRPYRYLNEILSPVRTLLSTRVARGRLAELNALNLVRSFHGSRDSVQSPGCRDGCVFEFSMAPDDNSDEPFDPPLGWSLSARARGLLDEHLEKHEKDKFSCIRGLLTGDGCLEAPACPVR